MRRLLRAQIVGLVCLASACSEENVSAWIGDLDGVEIGHQAGRPVEGVTPTPPRGPAAEAWLQSPGEDSALELARAYFPEFAPRPRSRPEPEPATPGRMLRVRAGASEDEETEIVTRGHVFTVRQLSAGKASVSKQLGEATFYGARHFWAPAGGQGADGLWLTSRVEEYVVTEAGAKPYRARYEVTAGDGIVGLRDAHQYLEFVDAEGAPALRLHYAVARDLGGHWRQGRVTMRGAVPQGLRGGLPAFALRGKTLQVEMTVELDGLEGPVVIDPGWSSTGSMSIDRYEHTATLLPTGKLLVAGGCTRECSLSPPAPPLSSAELYDPATGTWQATGSMTVSRENHAATLLLTGQVLVAGGGLPSAELYDVAAGTWQETGLMNRARFWATATLLSSGEVLMVGGNSGTELAAERYDPATATWTATGPMPFNPYFGHSATRLASGKVLVTGGEEGWYGSARAQLYDPATDSWSFTGSMSAGRSWHSLTLLPSGKALAAGGQSGPNGNSAELYDPATGTWSFAGTMADGLGGAAALLPSGAVLVLGLLGTQDGAIYDPSLGTWSATPSLIYPHWFATETVLPSGQVLVAGGDVKEAELYDPRSGAWSATPSQATARAYATATMLPSGKVLVAGGRGASGPTATAELYDPATGAWSATGSMAGARSKHTATLLSSGQVLVAGGDGPSGPASSAELYDPGPGTWSATGNLATGRSGHAATLLPNGDVLVSGGNAAGPLASAELYRPLAGSWRSAGAMATGRANHAAILLPDGNVLVTGGQGAPGFLGSAELYRRALDSWSVTGSLATARANHTSSPLPDGKVLVAGGEGAAGPLASAEVYTPATGTWSAAPAMSSARSRHTAAVLASGRVLVVAGLGAAGRLATSEVYDETAGAWYAAGSIAVARADATATFLPDGKILVTGGSSATGSLASGALYDDTGAADAWRPAVAALSATDSGATLTLTGTRLRGVSEANGGNPLFGAASDVPVVQLRPAGGGQGITAPAQTFSDTSITVTVPQLSDGYYALGVTANGITGGTIVYVDGPAMAPLFTAPASPVGSQAPAIAGTAEPGWRVTVFLDGTAQGEVAADADGLWSLVPVSPLADGPHVATATAVGPTGHASPMSQPWSFTVDTVAPASPVITGPSGTVSSAKPPLTGTSEPGSQVTVWVDGTIAGTSGANGAGAWSLVPGSPLAEGPHLATAQARDPAGNTGAVSGARAFAVDTVPPPPPVMVSPENGALLVSRTPVLSGTAEIGSTVTVLVDGAVAGVATVDGSGAWSCVSTLTLAQGAHIASARAKDAVGNVGQPSGSRAFTVDSVAPPPPVVVTPSEGAIESSRAPLISGTAEIGSQVTLWLDGASAGTVGTTSSGAWSFSPTSPLATGPHAVSAQATDAAGNGSASAGPRSFTVQPPRPEVPQILSPTRPVATRFPTIAGKATSGDSVDVLLDGALAGTVRPDAQGTWSFTAQAPLADGPHTSTAQARDFELIPSLMSSPFTFVVDTVAPETPTLETPGDGALVKTAAPRFAGTAEPLSTVSVELDGEVVGTPEAGADGAWTFTPPTRLGEGGHTVVLRATDAAGNVSPPSSARPFTVQPPKSFYGSGCSAAPAGGAGAWLLLLLAFKALPPARKRER